MAVYRFDGLELNDETFELRSDGVPIRMEPQVFDVLAYLVRNHQRVVGKDELLDKVWGDRYVSEAAVNSRLMAARRAIGDNGREQRMIQTVHGRGYRFVAPLLGESSSSETAGHANSVKEPIAKDGGAASSPAIGRAPGRDAELAQLESYLTLAKAGHRQVVFVVGEAGIGKTTLTEALSEQARLAGSLVLSAQCLEHRGRGETYLPLFDAIDRLGRSSAGSATHALLLQRAPSWAAQLPGLFTLEEHLQAQQRSIGTTAERMLREAIDLLEALAAQSPVLLILEDLHWSDQATVDLISALARRQEVLRLMVVATFRPGDARVSAHPISELAHDLRLRSRAQIVEVPPLPVEVVLRLLSSRVGDDQGSEDVARELHRRTEGNALFVTTLISDLPVGVLRALSGPVTTTNPLELPASLRAFLEQQFDRLETYDRQILEAASVIGPRFDCPALAGALGGDADEIEARCEAMVRRGQFILQVEEGSRLGYAFVHGLHQEVLYQRMLPSQKSRIHRRLATHFEQAYAETVEQHASELALHFARGRETAQAVHYLSLSAQQAALRGGFREAVLQITHALDLVPALEDPGERDRYEMNLRRLLASSLLVTRGFGHEQVLPELTRALELAHTLEEEQAASEILLHMASLLEYRSQHEQAENILMGLNTRPAEPASVRVPMHALLSCSYFHQGDFDRSRNHADFGLSAADTSKADERFAFLGEDPVNGCSEWSAEALWFLGYFDQARDRIEDAVAQAKRPDFHYTLASTQSHAARIYHLRREPALAREYAVATIRLAADQGYAYHHAAALVLAGWADVALGEAVGGLEAIRNGIEAHKATGADMDRPYFLAMQAEAFVFTGRSAEAKACIEHALSLIANESAYFYSAELHRLLGEILASENDTPGAESSFGKALDLAREQSARGLELRAATSLARLMRGLRRADEAVTMLQPLVDWFNEGYETADLVEAKELLRTLRQSPQSL